MIFRPLVLPFLLSWVLIANFCYSARGDDSRTYLIGNSLSANIVSGQAIERASSGTNSPLQTSQHIRCGSSLTATLNAVGDPNQAGVCVDTGDSILDLGEFPAAFQEDIDQLVLQPYLGATMQQEIDSTKTLIDLFRDNPANANDEVFIFATWGLQTADNKFLSVWNGHQATLDGDFVPSASTYELFKTTLEQDGYDVTIIPAGQAYANLGATLAEDSVGNLNDIEDLYRDDIHGSNAGRYLATLTAFLTLSGESIDEVSLSATQFPFVVESHGLILDAEAENLLRSVAANVTTGGGVDSDTNPRFEVGSTFMLVGDSFTNDGNWDWAGKVDDRFELQVDYFSEAGRTVQSMDSLFASQYQSDTYEAVVIAGGVNDFSALRTPEEILESINSIISKTNGEHIILTTIPPLRGRHVFSEALQANANRVDQLILALADSSENISVFDIRAVLDQDGDQIIDPALASADNFHPSQCAFGNECGMTVIAEAFVNQFSTTSIVMGVMAGDVNRDGAVNFLDISPFVALLANGGFQAEADIDQNEIVDFLDIQPFVEILVAE